MRPYSESVNPAADDADNSAFAVDYMTEGPRAHGFGRTDNGRTYSFRVSKNTLSITVYHEAAASDVPDSSEVVARAEISVDDVDLSDERSLIGAVREALDSAGAA